MQKPLAQGPKIAPDQAVLKLLQLLYVWGGLATPWAAWVAPSWRSWGPFSSDIVWLQPPGCCERDLLQTNKPHLQPGGHKTTRAVTNAAKSLFYWRQNVLEQEDFAEKFVATPLPRVTRR